MNRLAGRLPASAMQNEKIDIKGIDLKIDIAIQKTCEVSNATSGSTRSVLYILLITNILSLIAVVNTRPGNWLEHRIGFVQAKMHELQNTACSHQTTAAAHTGPCPYCLDSIRAVMNALQRNKVENIQTVRIPVLGNTFDVNDLGIISGFTFLVLMIILRLTIAREINNLKLALLAITERYPASANPEDFEAYIKKQKQKSGNESVKEEAILRSINYTRRKHHYNYLSMNEIYTMPPLDVEKKSVSGKISGWVVVNMYWLPFIVMAVITYNDIITFTRGSQLDQDNAWFGVCSEVILAILIALFSYLCTRQKITISRLYRNFKTSNYHYTYSR